MEIENPLGTKAFFDLELPGFSRDGAPLNVVYEIPAGSVAQPGVLLTVIDLSGYAVDLTGLSGSENNKFISKIDVQADPNGPTVDF